jgi:hypothetical protein
MFTLFIICIVIFLIIIVFIIISIIIIFFFVFFSILSHNTICYGIKNFFLHIVDSSYKHRISIPVPFSLSTTPLRRIEEWRYSATHSLMSALDEGEWSALRSGRFTPRERAPDTHWIGGWVGPRAVLDAVVKSKILSPRRKSNPSTPIVQPVAQRYTE